MAVWCRRPMQRVLIHSDKGSQYSSDPCLRFCVQHNLQTSTSRRGNCHDNAVAERFFQLLKRELIKRRGYSTRSEARQDVFDYIEMFYNSVRKHGYTSNLSPIDIEKQQLNK